MEGADVASTLSRLQKWNKLDILVACAAVVSLLLLKKLYNGYRVRLPPGPLELPVIGHLHLLARTTKPHHVLAKLAEKYGPIMYIRLGVHQNVVVTSADIVKEIFQGHDENFASRAQFILRKTLFDDLVFEPFGERVRMLRKVVTMELLNPKRLRQFKAVRIQTVHGALDSILREGRGNRPVNLGKILSDMTFNNMTQMMFNKTFYGEKIEDAEGDSESKGFDGIMQMITSLGVGAGIGDVLPWLRKLDLDGYEARVNKARNLLDSFLTKIITEHRHAGSAGDQRQEDFLDLLLQMQREKTLEFTDNRIKGVLSDMLVGGTDTSTTGTTWALAELMKNPTILKKVQEELDAVVGRGRLVEESDIEKLPYLSAVANESNRLHLGVVLLAPRVAVKAMKIRGFDIPKDARVITNIWAIQRDPKLWKNPLEFNPDRWLNSPINYRGNHFEFLPFGVGHRICPGMNLGQLMVLYVLAQLLHTCEVSLPEGMKPEDVSLEEQFGLVTCLKDPLRLVVSPRLPHSVLRQGGMNVDV